MTAPASLDLVGVRKAFGAAPVVAGIDLHVREGEFLTLLGPSGCGKTTTLNLVAGFLAPDAGDIRIGGRSMHGVPVFRRDIGLVFQDYALFPTARSPRTWLSGSACAASHAPRSRPGWPRPSRWCSSPGWTPGARLSSAAASGSAWRSPAPW